MKGLPGLVVVKKMRPQKLISVQVDQESLDNPLLQKAVIFSSTKHKRIFYVFQFTAIEKHRKQAECVGVVRTRKSFIITRLIPLFTENNNGAHIAEERADRLCLVEIVKKIGSDGKVKYRIICLS